LKKIIALLKDQKKDLTRLDRRLEKTRKKQVSFADPDFRSMPVGKGHGTEIGYNVQVSVDDKHKLILDHEVTNDVTNQGYLRKMAIRSKKMLDVKKVDLLANMGYYDCQEVAEGLEAGIKPWISKPNPSVNIKGDLFPKEDFQYSKWSDFYIYPAAKRLGVRFSCFQDGRNVQYYATTARGECRLRLIQPAGGLPDRKRSGSWRKCSAESICIRKI
jgi:hypothetical protein